MPDDPPSPGPGQGGSADDTRTFGLSPVSSEKTAVLAEFIEFYDREYHQAVRFVMNCGASLSAAEDAAQEAFLDVWKLMSLPGKWAMVESPRGWIRRVAMNKYRRPPGIRRAPVIVPLSVTTDAVDVAGGEIELSVSALLVRGVLQSLDPELRAVMAFSLDGFTAAESGRHRKILAEELGVAASEKERDQ
jgi:DNA-directed RNA polymerase specialized sigma24 family protein